MFLVKYPFKVLLNIRIEEGLYIGQCKEELNYKEFIYSWTCYVCSQMFEQQKKERII